MIYSAVIRHGFISVAITSILAAGGVATAGTASATESSAPMTVTAASSPLGAPDSLSPFPNWCPFGTHHGKGSGCRGGSINDNERLNDSLTDTGGMYKDAGKCAAAGIAGGVSSQLHSPVPSFGGLVKESLVGGAVCGSQSPRGKF
jgi:hypothetical protein